MHRLTPSRRWSTGLRKELFPRPWLLIMGPERGTSAFTRFTPCIRGLGTETWRAPTNAE